MQYSTFRSLLWEKVTVHVVMLHFPTVCESRIQPTCCATRETPPLPPPPPPLSARVVYEAVSQARFLWAERTSEQNHGSEPGHRVRRERRAGFKVRPALPLQRMGECTERCRTAAPRLGTAWLTCATSTVGREHRHGCERRGRRERDREDERVLRGAGGTGELHLTGGNTEPHERFRGTVGNTVVELEPEPEPEVWFGSSGPVNHIHAGVLRVNVTALRNGRRVLRSGHVGNKDRVVFLYFTGAVSRFPNCDKSLYCPRFTCLRVSCILDRDCFKQC